MIRRAVLEGIGKGGDALAIEVFAGPVRNPMATAELIANRLIAVKGAALSVGFRRGLVLVHRGKGVAIEIGLETFRRDEDVPVMRITCTARTRTGIREFKRVVEGSPRLAAAAFTAAGMVSVADTVVAAIERRGSRGPVDALRGRYAYRYLRELMGGEPQLRRLLRLVADVVSSIHEEYARWVGV